MNSTPLRGLLLVISATFAISCGGDDSFSPTTPSLRSVMGQSGAVIVGQVNSGVAPTSSGNTLGMPASAPTFTNGDSTSVTVKVVGTNISTTTNGQGQFTLTGVPPGEVRLEFGGRGGPATISFSGVQADEEIRISVTLNGTDARVESESRSKRGGGGNRLIQSELKGAVSGLTGTCPRLSFTVRGTKVTTSDTTQFDDLRCADINNDVVVEVKGSRQADGAIAATKVQIVVDDNGDDDGDQDGRAATPAEPIDADD
jgi:hypothetical protein